MKTLVRLRDRGLPGPLPSGERLVWQGEPDWKALARRAFHVREVALWFGLFAAWRTGETLFAGKGAAAAAHELVWLAIPAALAIGVLLLLAWGYGRTTTYSITTRRVVITSGVAVPLTLNIPFRVIESASLRRHGDGTGDVPLRLIKGERIGFMFLWPNVRPWKLARPEPMFRALPEPERAAAMLSQALAESVAAEGGQSRVEAPSAAPVSGMPQPAWREAGIAT